jgi:hypothetical protein
VLFLFCSFLWYVTKSLWRASLTAGPITFESGQRIALVSCMILVALLGLLQDVISMGVMMMPLWTMIGIFWLEPPRESEMLGDFPPPLVSRPAKQLPSMRPASTRPQVMSLPR